MPEYFIVANSFAAPFVSDQSMSYASGSTPEEALTDFAAGYRHPSGLFSADAYASADAFHKGQPLLAKWRSNKAIAVEGAASVYSSDPHHAEVNGKQVAIRRPYQGRVVS